MIFAAKLFASTRRKRVVIVTSAIRVTLSMIPEMADTE